jgi:hypothetical protein
MLLDDQELRERVGRLEMLLEEIESFEDPEARARTAEMVQTLLELYGEGLGRIVESIGRLGSEDLKDELLGDELITHLLLLHGLHPVDVETRTVPGHRGRCGQSAAGRKLRRMSVLHHDAQARD